MNLFRDLFPAIMSGAALGAFAGLYAGYSGGTAFTRGLGLFLIGWSLFVVSRGLLAVFVLPIVLLEVVIGGFLPFAIAYPCFRWLGVAIGRRTSMADTDGGDQAGKNS